MENIEGIMVYSIMEVEDDIYGDVDPYSYDGYMKLKKYLKENNGHYYARPSEYFDDDAGVSYFNSYEGIMEAKRKGCSMVILEDLS